MKKIEEVLKYYGDDRIAIAMLYGGKRKDNEAKELTKERMAHIVKIIEELVGECMPKEYTQAEIRAMERMMQWAACGRYTERNLTIKQFKQNLKKRLTKEG